MTFNDIFKSSFLENDRCIPDGYGAGTDAVLRTGTVHLLCVPQDLRRSDVLPVLRRFVDWADHDYHGPLLAVTSNVVLSLGMVGVLSIVRFRTAIKEPMDIAFLFWAIAGGIVLAAGMIPLAIFGSVIIGIIMIVFCNRRAACKPYIAVISCADADAEHTVAAYLKAHTEKTLVKSKSAQKGCIELSYEVTLKQDNTDFITDLSELDGVSSAVLVSYNGDYMG